MNESKNPIINYLNKEPHKIVPDEVFDTLKPILHDKDVDSYLTGAVNTCALAIKRDPEMLVEAFRIVVLAGMGVGYMYGAEGNKTTADVAAEVLNDLNIKMQEEKK